MCKKERAVKLFIVILVVFIAIAVIVIAIKGGKESLTEGHVISSGNSNDRLNTSTDELYSCDENGNKVCLQELDCDGGRWDSKTCSCFTMIKCKMLC